jgi:hypothetical protein
MNYVLRAKESHEIVSESFSSFSKLADFRVDNDLIESTYIDILEEENA